VLFIGLALAASAAAAANVARTEPANGAKDVALDVGVVTIHFDQRPTVAYGFSRAPEGEFPPLAGKAAVSWADATTMAIKVQRLKPATPYAFILKPQGGEGTLVQFTTVGGEAPVEPVQPPPPPPEKPAAKPTLIGLWESEGDKSHWEFKADGTITYSRPEENYELGMTGKYALEDDIVSFEFEGQKKPMRSRVRFVDASTMEMGGARSATRYRRIGGTPPAEPAGPLGPAVTTRLPMQVGWKFQGRRVLLLDLTLSAQDGSKAPLQYLKQTLAFIERVEKLEENFPVEVTRKLTQAELETRGYNEQQTKKQQVAQPGTVLRVRTVGRRAGAVIDGTGEAIDEDFEEAIGGPLAPELYPEGDLKAGMRWSYKGADLGNRMPFECMGGQADLRVESVARDPQSGLVVAKIRGPIQTKVQPGDIPLDLKGQIVIDLPVAIGIPLVAKIEGTLTAQTTFTDPQGRQHPVTVSGKGSFVQTVGPAMNIVKAAGGRQVKAK
jgi:hypothetical protein